MKKMKNQMKNQMKNRLYLVDGAKVFAPDARSAVAFVLPRSGANYVFHVSNGTIDGWYDARMP